MITVSADQLARRLKSKQAADTAGFTCFLVYFIVKAVFLLVVFRYDNLLKHEAFYIIPFVVLLITNTYLMLTVGKDPGFEASTLEQNELLTGERNDNNFCNICNCRIKIRGKHCYKCGTCVRKFDHHCPWINSCVGENNHFKFCVLLLTHALQATLASYICFKSMGYFQYALKDGSYSPEYGVFSVFCIFMLFYVAFAGGLLIFHLYLIGANTTSKQLMERRKCWYLTGVKGNPFSEGMFKNLAIAIYPEEGGRQWLIDLSKCQVKSHSIWSNDYYQCC